MSRYPGRGCAAALSLALFAMAGSACYKDVETDDKLPGYDFLHLTYYCFNTENESAGFIQKMDFDGNDGSVKWWTRVYPDYSTGGDNPVSFRYALARYDITPINFGEIAFNVVDENDNILTEEDLAAAKISVRFDYADPSLAGTQLPEADRSGSFNTYGDLWTGNSTFRYRTKEKKFIPVRGHLYIKDENGTERELPTRFTRAKASVKYPEVMLDYSNFSVVRWTPFLEPEVQNHEVILNTHKFYRIPVIAGIKSLKDERPGGISFDVIKDGEWVKGNITSFNATAGTTVPANGNGYIQGVSSREAYGIKTRAESNFNGPGRLAKSFSLQYSSDGVNFVDTQNEEGTLTPYLAFDYSSEIQLQGEISVKITAFLDSPWMETINCPFEIIFKGQ